MNTSSIDSAVFDPEAPFGPSLSAVNSRPNCSWLRADPKGASTELSAPELIEGGFE
jgi:hypothetical protein